MAISGKGCICLDIDGTLTADPHKIPEEVADLLKTLYSRGWHFLFVTGRTFSFANHAIDSLDFPYFFAVQNGADLLKMPEKKLIQRFYLSSQFIVQLESIYRGFDEDFIIYSGYQLGDFCYFRSKRFSEKMLDHLEVIKALSPEPWKEVDEFAFAPSDQFPLVKCLGTVEQMKAVHKELEKIPEVHATYIRDPLSAEGFYVNLITSHLASKGQTLARIRSFLEPGLPFIAAGDDRNDWSMLQEADIAILMKTAPKEMFPIADILAEPASELGIISALLKATGET
jgi:HAD superfamily hydrolase (TIGR01484 family)